MTEINQPNTGTVQPQQDPVQVQAPAVDDAKARTTEQFNKLLENNRKLHETNEQLQRQIGQRQNVNNTFQPIQDVPAIAQHPARQQVNAEDFVEIDPATGQPFINEQRLKSKLDEINKKASQAERTIENYIKTTEKREIDRQNSEAFITHPELNPESEKFDLEFNKQVRGMLLDSMYNMADYGGRPLSFKEAGDYVKSKATPAQVKEEQVVKVAEGKPAEGGNDLKMQSAAGVNNQQPQQQRQTMQDSEELRQLVMATRKGNLDALTQRLMNTEHSRKEGE